MKLLLDTHIWLWSIREPDRLGHGIHQQLIDSNNELWLSPISAWEAFLLNARNKIQIVGSLTEWLADATKGFREAPLTHEIVLAAQQLPWAHRDPADRFLATTAYVLDLTLVTADHRLLALREIKTLSNR